MYEDDESINMEFDSSEEVLENDDSGADGADEPDDEGEDEFVSAGAGSVMGPLDIFAAEDDTAKIGLLKKIFSAPERQSFIDTYKEEEASQAELNTESEFGEDYYLLRYIKNHPEVLADREEEVAEALGMD